MEAPQNESIARAIARKRVQQELYGLDEFPISNFDTLVHADIGYSMIPRKRNLKRSLKRSSPSNNTSNNENKHIVRTTVSFSSKKLVKKISHLNNMPDWVIADRWFRAEDYYQMKLSCKHIVRLIDNENGSGTIIDEEKETKRGLEGLTKSGSRERRNCQRDAYSVVFNEQDRQWTNELEDPHRLSVLYKDCSKECVTTAIKKAEADESCIQEYLAETRMDELKRLERIQEISGLINRMNLDSVGDSDRTNVAAKCA